MPSKHNPNDADNSEIAVHHTLGLNRHQAMPGDILSSFTLTGPHTVAVIPQLIEALVALGATDSTT